MGPGGFFLANPDLADILGRTDLDFENFYFLDFFGSQISGLGPAWAHPLGPRVGPPTWAQRGPTHLGPSGELKPVIADLHRLGFCNVFWCLGATSYGVVSDK